MGGKGANVLANSNPILEISKLRIEFDTPRGVLQVVNAIDLTVREGETLGLVGESGCGKSVTSMSIMGLLPEAVATISGGSIRFRGKELTTLSDKEMRKVRGNEISIIFQEPMTSLNPVFTIAQQLVEPLRQHKRLSKRERRERIIEMLRKVGIPRVEQIVDEYPHQLSGGMRQRVMIALAMLGEPQLLIADEPTTALDVTIQAQILELMKAMKQENGMAVMLITHDLGVVAEMCDRVAVMYAGQVVEVAEVRDLFDRPKHPYTKGLLHSLPTENARKQQLQSIKGSVPRPNELPPGCAFAPRCPNVKPVCEIKLPDMYVTENQYCRCWIYDTNVGGGAYGEATVAGG
ncbi:ABC transporter ATP-binding protein [Brevibacillus choshinensis]|nr:ABC transporter ATP-binding protein [Brevibacillus choshinensis]